MVERSPLPDVAPDPLQIPPNAATRTIDHSQAHAEAGAWDAFRALCAPSLVFNDRRRAMLMTGDCDYFVASSQYIHSHGAHGARTVLATGGDTLALELVHWTGADGAPEFEIDVLRLTEVDAEGRIVARILFDPDDRRAAGAELFERYARSDAAGCIPAAVFEALRAVNTHDLERVRATLPDDFLLNDHRRTGLGRLETAEDYLAALAALFEQAPDVSVETLYIVAVEPHCVLMVARNFGTLREGGEFESVYVRIMLHRGDRIIGVEMFEPEELDAARARFEELRRARGPDPSP